MKRSGSTLLSSAKPRRSGRQRGLGCSGRELMPDWPLAVARSVCRARGLLTQRQAQHIWSQRIFCCSVVGRLAASYRWRHSWQHAIESHAATDGGFVSCVGSINNNGRIARTAAATRTQCRVDTRPGQCGASSLQGGNHTFPHSETVRHLPVRRAQGAGVGISKGWKRQVISRPQETRLQDLRVG